LANEPSVEASFAEVGQVIAGRNFVRFLTPDIASKNDARHGIDYSVLGQLDAMSGIDFLRHVWRQKAAKLCTSNHLPNYG